MVRGARFGFGCPSRISAGRYVIIPPVSCPRRLENSTSATRHSWGVGGVSRHVRRSVARIAAELFGMLPGCLMPVSTPAVSIVSST